MKGAKHKIALILVLAVFLAGGLFLNNWLNSEKAAVSAGEIYPLFECPCCGKPIDECECSMAAERRAFIDGLIAGNLSEEETILTYVGRYGLASFMNKELGEQFRKKLTEKAPADRPIISLSAGFYDFGDVSQKEGTVTTFFKIKNEGKSDLIIDKLESFCGCTSASVVYQGQEGPRFYMAGHGQDIPEEWQVVIPPGQTAQLKVYYDPDVHPDFRGAATREVSVLSNDPIYFEKKVAIELNQID